MNKLIYTRKNIYIYLSLFLTLPLAMYNVENILQSLICSHYTTLVLNNIHIALSYQRIGKIHEMKNLLIPRIGLNKYINNCCIMSFFSATFYCIFLYIFNFLFFRLPTIHCLPFILIFMIINYIVLLFEEVILLQNIDKTQKSVFYLFLAILVNFYFHYRVVIPIVETIFK